MSEDQQNYGQNSPTTPSLSSSTTLTTNGLNFMLPVIVTLLVALFILIVVILILVFVFKCTTKRRVTPASRLPGPAPAAIPKEADVEKGAAEVQPQKPPEPAKKPQVAQEANAAEKPKDEANKEAKNKEASKKEVKEATKSKKKSVKEISKKEPSGKGSNESKSEQTSSNSSSQDSDDDNTPISMFGSTPAPVYSQGDAPYENLTFLTNLQSTNPIEKKSDNSKPSTAPPSNTKETNLDTRQTDFWGNNKSVK